MGEVSLTTEGSLLASVCCFVFGGTCVTFNGFAFGGAFRVQSPLDCYR